MATWIEAYKEALYTYKAKCINVVDGDTFDFEVDLGYKITHTIRVRLRGADTPEKNSKNAEERAHAADATAFAEAHLLGQEVFIRTEKDKIGIYGRYTATVVMPDDRLFSHLIKEAGLEKKASYE